MTTITAPRRRPIGLLYQLGVDTGCLLLGFRIGVASFVAIVTGLTLGVGLLVTVLGPPLRACLVRHGQTTDGLAATQAGRGRGVLCSSARAGRADPVQAPSSSSS